MSLSNTHIKWNMKNAEIPVFRDFFLVSIPLGQGQCPHFVCTVPGMMKPSSYLELLERLRDKKNVIEIIIYTHCLGQWFSTFMNSMHWPIISLIVSAPSVDTDRSTPCFSMLSEDIILHLCMKPRDAPCQSGNTRAVAIHTAPRPCRMVILPDWVLRWPAAVTSRWHFPPSRMPPPAAASLVPYGVSQKQRCGMAVLPGDSGAASL